MVIKSTLGKVTPHQHIPSIYYFTDERAEAESRTERLELGLRSKSGCSISWSSALLCTSVDKITTGKRSEGLLGHPHPSPPLTKSLRDRCRWSDAGGSRAPAAAVARARGASGPALFGSSSFGGGSSGCGAVPPVNCLRPRAARPPSSTARRDAVSRRVASGRGGTW